MSNKLKRVLKYYSDMAASINYHSKNGAMNTNAMKKELKSVQKTISELYAVNNAEQKNVQNIKNTLDEELRQIKDILRFDTGANNVKFSIVTATYNSGEYLSDYFFSMVKQKKVNIQENLEIIIVDDGSTDNTASIVEKWQEHSPLNIKYIYQENKGQSEARNLGLKYITNDWVTFIDSDDFISPNYFYNISRNILEHNEELYVLPWKFHFEK